MLASGAHCMRVGSVHGPPSHIHTLSSSLGPRSPPTCGELHSSCCSSPSSWSCSWSPPPRPLAPPLPSSPPSSSSSSLSNRPAPNHDVMSRLLSASQLAGGPPPRPPRPGAASAISPPLLLGRPRPAAATAAATAVAWVRMCISRPRSARGSLLRRLDRRSRGPSCGACASACWSWSCWGSNISASRPMSHAASPAAAAATAGVSGAVTASGDVAAAEALLAVTQLLPAPADGWRRGSDGRGGSAPGPAPVGEVG